MRLNIVSMCQILTVFRKEMTLSWDSRKAIKVPREGRFEGETLLSYDTFSIVLYIKKIEDIYIYKGG